MTFLRIQYLPSSLQETDKQNCVNLVSSLYSTFEFFSQVESEVNRKRPGHETIMVTSKDGTMKTMLNWPTKKKFLNTISTQGMLPALGVCLGFFFLLYWIHSKAIKFQHHFFFFDTMLYLCRRLVIVATTYNKVGCSLCRTWELQAASTCPKGTMTLLFGVLN